MIGALVAKHNVQKAFRQLNQKRLSDFMAGWAEDGQFHYPGELSVSGSFLGRAKVEGWFEHFFTHFASINFSLNHICVENIFDVTGNNNLVAQWRVELITQSGSKVENVGINLIKIRNRKVTEVRDFFFYMERLPMGWGENNWRSRTDVITVGP